MSKLLKSKAPYFLAVATAFFVYQLYLLANSFHADYTIYQSVSSTIASRGFLFWPLFWLASELVGEIGLIIRFAGACFLLAFAWVLFRKKEFLLAHLRNGVLLEAVHYLFFIPFIVYLFIRPNATIVRFEAALSYTIQILLIFPVFIIVYTKLKSPNMDRAQVLKWAAIGITSYAFALWVKHFLFNLYALPINFTDPVLLVGFLNSTLTLFIAAIIMLVGFLHLIKGKSTKFNPKALGAALVCIGVYFIVYALVALINQSYLSYLTLTELWAITLPILGLSFIAKKDAATLS